MSVVRSTFYEDLFPMEHVTAVSVPQGHSRTPPWFHFKKSLQTINASRKIDRRYEGYINDNNTSLIPATIYIPPRSSVSSSLSVPRDLSSMFRKIERSCSSFRKTESVPNSYNELNISEAQLKTPEKYLSPLKYKWESVTSVAKVRRGRSVTNVTDPSYEETILNMKEQYLMFDKSSSGSKFSKKYIKMKLAKLFRSSSKVFLSSKCAAVDLEPIKQCDPVTNNKESPKKLKTEELIPSEEFNEALRNTSFTAAMMSKGVQILDPPPTIEEPLDHTKQIPSSTLRFWRKPTEEKLKASQRRTQENIHGSSEVLMRFNPTFCKNKQQSELSLFYDEGNYQQEYLKGCDSEIRSSVEVPGYDKALNRYQHLINQTRHISRRDKTLSLAYETEINNYHNRSEMRTSQSSINMTLLTRSHSVAQGLNPDTKRSPIGDTSYSPSHSGRATFNAQFSQGSNMPSSPYATLCNFPVSPFQPPPYDNNLINKRLLKKKISTKSVTSCNEVESTTKYKPSDNTLHQKAPRPPPRCDSLIRSFERMYKNLTSSLSQPRGDSFKMFRSQRDYENWLKNLPYNNPDKIAALLKMRSKMARRKCVSELIDIHIVNVDSDKRRRHSWPLLTGSGIPLSPESSRRANSLSRVKLQKQTMNDSKNVESPSLYNYSRLYCLRNYEPKSPSKDLQKDSGKNISAGPFPPRLTQTASRVKRPFKYKYGQSGGFNASMSESCHESINYSVI